MIAIKEKANCTGCSACKNICPKNAIEMRDDCEGFSYPVVNTKTCVDCSLCESVCPVTGGNAANIKRVCYAAYSKDEGIRKNSSSGGIFSVLAMDILLKGGYVFGAAFDGVTRVKHIYIKDKKDLFKLRTSKYIQSEIGDSYKETKKFLETGSPVLFTGTPCQIAGLKRFLGKEYDNLYTQDIICHGVPSQEVWAKYICAKEKAERQKILSANFRDKTDGWKKFSVKYKLTDTCKTCFFENDLFCKAFLKNIILRPSCYSCEFKNKNFYSDITLGDFWGVESVMPEMDDDHGTSLVICNTDKGNALLTDVSQSLMLKKVYYDAAVKHNSAAIKSVNKPGSRDMFFNRIKHHNIIKELSLFCGEDEKSIKKVQLLEDFNSVKKEKGRTFSLLWAIKNILNMN